ncbi:MAG: hypothetical protein Q4A56_01685 [Porphyromonadaceae bacterium]|nr:hypothetical protein [Porphyromonadaceae bacterium]
MKRICFIIAVLAALLIYGCVPHKKTAKTEVVAHTDYSKITNELRTQHTRLDAVTEAISSTKEQLAEWMNESIDYREQKFDSLGRLISVVEQTTSRNGGKEVAKQGDTYVYQGVTVSQVDSVVAAQMKQLRSELSATSKTTEKRGLAWWQSVLMWAGALFLVLIVFSLVKRFIFKRI